MATRIQLKRSSVLGKRPSGQYLEPGELALNTNQADPGLFFETNSGAIAKVGPTHLGVQPPASDVGYGPGETWLDAGNGTMNIWVPALDKWVPVQSPLFGGATTAIFVGSEFPEASDDLSNDGIARPFATLNRAMIEVARRSILSGRADDLYNGRFTILLLPGRNIVYNEPGVSLGEFEELVSGFQEDQPLTQDQLRIFNGLDGGLLVPRGTSIIALDLRKTVLQPTYYPFWSRTLFEVDPALIEARSSILKWTGNCYFTSFTFKDKVGEVSVTKIDGEADDVAVLRSVRPHGFRALVTSASSSNEIIAADRVTLSYPTGVSQLYDDNPVAAAGEYYADPIDTFTFRLRKVTDASILLRKDLPKYGTPGATPPEFANLTYALTSHHRLSALEYATQPELNVFYSKVQRAFSLLTFSGTVNNAEVAPGETTIVTNTPAVPNYGLDTVINSSPYIFNCSVRSDWGLSAAIVDGSKVSGFKSALFCNFTVVSLQNDAEVYEIYDSVSQSWISLKQKYSNATAIPLEEVTNEQAISYMISPAVKVEDIRFFFRPKFDLDGGAKSSGLTDPTSDTRHYAVLTSNGGFSQIVSSFAIGVGINYWSLSGGQISVTNANSNFGGIALRAEGFAGIGTAGGAEAADKNFIVEGIRRPAAITRQMVQDSSNIKKVYGGSRIISTTATTLTLDTAFDTSSILPFTLKPGTYIWVENYATGSVYKAQLATTGSVLTNDNLTINIVSGTNDIHTAVFGGVSADDLSLPYLRRFIDPRPPVDRNYSLWLSNSSGGHRPPEVASVLRFAETPGAGTTNLLKIGAQLDPGLNGGWGHIFQVSDSRTKAEGDNPNGADPLIVPANSAYNYYVTVLPVDQFRPWIDEGSNGFDTNAVDIDYPQGFYCSYLDRIYYAAKNDQALANLKPLPTSGVSVWLRAKNFEYCQPVGDAWVAQEGIGNAEDPFFDSYPQGATYPRGVQYDRTNPTFNLVIDEDDGTTTLGILNVTGNTNLANPNLYDPWWQPSKAAITRLLTLIGFSYDDIEIVLQPQLWTSRNIASDSLPSVNTAGYALATGKWPMEFNRPSTIRCGNHTWEWSGYINYAKGLQQYQDSSLSLRERFDAMSSEMWGGAVFSTGTDERGEFAITGKAVAGGTGITLLRTDDTRSQFAPQDVMA